MQKNIYPCPLNCTKKKKLTIGPISFYMQYSKIAFAGKKKIKIAQFSKEKQKSNNSNNALGNMSSEHNDTSKQYSQIHCNNNL